MSLLFWSCSSEVDGIEDDVAGEDDDGRWGEWGVVMIGFGYTLLTMYVVCFSSHGHGAVVVVGGGWWWCSHDHFFVFWIFCRGSRDLGGSLVGVGTRDVFESRQKRYTTACIPFWLRYLSIDIPGPGIPALKYCNCLPAEVSNKSIFALVLFFTISLIQQNVLISHDHS